MSSDYNAEKIERYYGTLKKDRVRFFIGHILSYILAFANFLLYLLYIISPKIIGFSQPRIIKEVKELKSFVFNESFISNLYILKDYIKPGNDIISKIIVPTLFFIINYFIALLVIYAILWLLFKPLGFKKKIGGYDCVSEEYGSRFEFDPILMDVNIHIVSLIVGILLTIMYFVGLGFIQKAYAPNNEDDILPYMFFLFVPIAIAMTIISWIIIYVIWLVNTPYDMMFFIDTRRCQKYLKDTDGYKKYAEELRDKVKKIEERNKATQNSDCTYGVSVDPAFTASLKSSFGNSSSSQEGNSSYDGDAYGMGDPNYNPVGGNGM